MTTPFTFAGALVGARAALVLAPAIVVFGCTFGMLAATVGINLIEAAAMSALVCAGTAQFAALQLWSEPVSWVATGIASLVMNARYLLLGATLRGWFAGLSPLKAYLSLFFMYDGNWATATRDRARGPVDAAHLLGGGIVMCAIWTVATVAGHMFGGLLGDPRKFGLDFVITAFFASMAVTLWRGRTDIVPVASAIVAAVAVDRLTTGPWYIVAGAVVGCGVAAMRFNPPQPGERDAA